MKVETQIKTLLKVLSKGIFEKEHILAMAHLKHHHHRKSFWDYLSVLLGCDAREKKHLNNIAISKYRELYTFLMR